VPQPYPDWAGLPEGLLLQMFEIMTLAQGGRELVRARQKALPTGRYLPSALRRAPAPPLLGARAARAADDSACACRPRARPVR
jgi:hypothetical protein